MERNRARISFHDSRIVGVCLRGRVPRLHALGDPMPHRNCGSPQLVGLLQVEPGLRCRPEVPRQRESCVGGDAVARDPGAYSI